MKSRYGIVIALGIPFLWFFMPTGDVFRDVPYATVAFDTQQQLLGARIAPDGQWRFPTGSNVPIRFELALLAFEDRYFHHHPGFNPVSILRAVRTNLQAQSIKSGASTITMQVARMRGGATKRTYLRKLMELGWALRLESTHSKRDILQLYVDHAPFGGNVVGLEAACWRYFGRPPSDLTWAEAAFLAVLPNAPALIHPGRNRTALIEKRDRLLQRLHDRGHFDEMELSLAKAEIIPAAPLPLPNETPHLIDYLVSMQGEGKRFETTIELSIQRRLNLIAQQHHERLQGNQIMNVSILAADTRTGVVKGYVGNVGDSHVDVIQAPRSSGSILKPFLFARMVDQGRILPTSLITDVPVSVGGFQPQNFSKRFEGMVPADQALARSLNIPAVMMLRDYGVEVFHHDLMSMGMNSLPHPPSHYGLSLILGGAESTLWNVTAMYASLGRVLLNYDPARTSDVAYSYQELRVVDRPTEPRLSELSPTSVYATLEALTMVQRPDEEPDPTWFQASRRMAWKTGTSYGHRDAWAIGVTPDITVGVWVGNDSGEGRPGLTGITVAAPVLFDVVNRFPDAGWFREPIFDSHTAVICRKSGFLAISHCTETDTVQVTLKGLESPPCPFHKAIQVDADARYRVDSSVLPISEIRTIGWFVLPPLQEWFYRQSNPNYRTLPPMHPRMKSDQDEAPMHWIYPYKTTDLVIPVELDGETGRALFEVAHRNPESELYWHLDGTYLGATRDRHQMGLAPPAGQHQLTVVDSDGFSLSARFRVLP